MVMLLSQDKHHERSTRTVSGETMTKTATVKVAEGTGSSALAENWVYPRRSRSEVHVQAIQSIWTI
jgi:hypothetical protein